LTDDAQLVERAVRRDPQAWAEIYERYAPQLLGFFVNQLRDAAAAEDMTADVFLEALQAADRFHGNPADLRSWLFRIARNNLIDRIRRDRRATLDTIESASETELARALPSVDPGDEALAALDRERVQEAIRSLSPDQREVILLRLGGGLSGPEIATIVGKTTGAVKALQHRALATLARILGAGTPGAKQLPEEQE
jgi:RNA polymerase sigma-70 factor (ECF subfamily)